MEWQPIETAPTEGDFLAESPDGDWLKVTNQPDVFKTGKRIVCHGLSGRFWAPTRWAPIPQNQSAPSPE